MHKADGVAANTLARELAKLACGGNIKVSFFDGNSRPKTKIFFKKCATSQPPQELSSIRIKSDSGNIEIEYPDESRAMNAVGIFLRKFCGMRFYAPGELGTHFKKKKNLSIPDGESEFKDAYFSIGFYAPTKDAKRRGEVNRWLKLNGAHLTAGNFSHNLKNIFDEEFRRKHPEILARDSDGSIKYLAQYDILNPTAAAQAAKKADEYFLEYPQAKMFSVGIDDFSEFDERPQTLAHNRGNFRGFPDYSNAVFEFSAKSAKLIAQKHPSKLVGCIAYLACENPPSFTLPGNLVPYFTTDRANYFDAKYKELDFKTLDAWGKTAKTFGIYDYDYGSPYPFPREIGPAIAEGIARAHKAGARAYYAELNPVYAYDAKKCAEIFAELDLPLDPDAAKIAGEEFYKNLYGAAGKYVKEFFDTAQNAQFAKRAARGDSARWLGLFKLECSAEIFDECDISEMEKMLDGYLSFVSGEGGEKSTFVDMNELILSIINKFRNTKALIRYSTNDQVSAIQGREQALKRALTNIISNAFDYGKTVAVSLESNNNKLEVAVDDDGPGIPADKREEVFKAFYRLEGSRNKETGGVGLGLSIAKDIITSHGGKIELLDSPIGGLRVLVSIPL